ncbi:MAG: GlsB/YeaQ/YmgE family stress response membrane protein [Planctomycetaceae bacterium]|jgi:uncharacterized membrane protein YeaQ/YmgE (transglycosylase-associated protein family)|nr:GlsB/YeaQ/YmgE family stress response membrane protein [Planctomycetaceae bacterium]
MELSAVSQSWVYLILLWVGFGAVVGLAANAFLPAGSPSGFFGNLVIGVAGSCAGPVTFVFVLKPQNFHPMSPIGFTISVLASILLLVLYRSLLFVSGMSVKKG